MLFRSVTTQKIQVEEVEEPVRVKVRKTQVETRTVREPKTIQEWVGYETTQRVPRTVVMRIPVDAYGRDVVSSTTVTPGARTPVRVQKPEVKKPAIKKTEVKKPEASKTDAGKSAVEKPAVEVEPVPETMPEASTEVPAEQPAEQPAEKPAESVAPPATDSGKPTESSKPGEATKPVDNVAPASVNENVKSPAVEAPAAPEKPAKGESEGAKTPLKETDRKSTRLNSSHT